MEIDRIELAECGSPEKLIAEILRQVPAMPIPVPIEELAAAVDITDIHRFDTKNFEGGLITQPERATGIIVVNASSVPQRQRFTIGHELGHYLILAHQGDQFTCTKADLAVRNADRDDRKNRMEVEANRFSAGILMPLKFFKPEMRELGSPDLEHILALAECYDTSREATALHYALHHDEPCAVILSVAGRVARMFKPSTFPFLDVHIGQPLPPTSLSARLPVTERTAWAEVDRNVWLSAEGGRRWSLQEQAMRFGGERMLTLLTYDPSDAQEDEDEGMPDAFDVWENPRFPSKSRRR